MHHPTRVPLRGFLPFLSLLAGCPPANSISVPSNCAVGEVLVLAGGRWECGPPPKLTLPPLSSSCFTGSGQLPAIGVAISSNNDELFCVDKDDLLPKLLTEARSELDTLAAQVAAASQGPSYYRGVTVAKSTGFMQAPGMKPGLASGAALCAAEYAGSHLCSMLEIYDSVAQGRVTPDLRIPKSWIFLPAGTQPNGATQPLDGLADSCASYTYGGDDQGWSGRAVEWTVLATSYLGLKFYGGTSAACGSSLPLACCGGAP